MVSLKSILAGAALAASAMAAQSAPVLQIDGAGKLAGALGVTIGANTYNVAFVDGLCAAVYSGCDEASDFLFQTQADANAASQAIIAQVLETAAGALFDAQPDMTVGCSDQNYCWLVTHFWQANSGPRNMNVLNQVASNSLGGPYFDPDASIRADLTYAVWTRADNTVPTPGTLALAGLGLGLAAFMSRRRTAA